MVTVNMGTCKPICFGRTGHRFREGRTLDLDAMFSRWNGQQTMRVPLARQIKSL
jgi:hypothetical protein